VASFVPGGFCTGLILLIALRAISRWLETWLADENFGTAGHQRQALADIRASLRTALPA